MSRQFLAIDIRNHSISAVLLTIGLKSLSVQDAKVIAWEQPDDTFKPGAEAMPMDESNLHSQTENHAPLKQALTALAAQYNWGDTMVIVGLPTHEVFFRNLQVPFKEEKKIRQILAFELEPTLPISVDRLVFDFQVTNQNEKTEVLAAAIDRQYLDLILATFTQVGMSPQLIVPGGFPLITALAQHGHDLPDHYLIADADTDQVALFALTGGRILFARSIPLDTAAQDAAAVLALRIRQTLTAYNESTPTAYTPADLFLSGPGLTLTATDELAQSLGMTAHQIDLQRVIPRVDISQRQDLWQPLMSDSALALAMIAAEGGRCLEFHRSGSVLRDLWATYKPYVRGPAMLITMVLIIFIAGFFWNMHLLQQQVDGLNREITAAITSAFPDIGRISDRPADQMRSRLETLKKKLTDPSHSAGQAKVIDILNQISQSMPKDKEVLMNRLVIAADGITIAGETVDFNTVEDIKNRLEQSDLFNTVDIPGGAKLDKNEKIVRFTLKINL